ncbi:hypothetical protein CCACVL1_14447 [Corchorus capsularis]|uniref:ENT domain-containing protein n=1 Tax=Corchorus capsularis TaxID=210143 RepID=A0A1R3I732_COCAP|nr:hypothetical protein CCACVL1_14447 [Corchorus capsularis]
MKLRKGNSIEVLRRDQDPCGSWFTATILSADGDNCIVRYKQLMDREGKRVVEKVPGKDVRPVPPTAHGKSWAVGDIAEVFDIRCWRVGKIAKVLKNNNRFVIKFFGSIQLKEFDASSLRVRQVWHGNQWVVIGKVAPGKDFANNLKPKIPDRASGLLFRTSSNMSRNIQFGEKDREGQYKVGANNGTMCLSIRAITRGYAHESEECNMDLLVGGTVKKRKSPPCSRGCDESLKRTFPPSFNQVGIDKKFIKQSASRFNRMENTAPRCSHDSSRLVWSTEDSDQCSVASCSSNGVTDYAGQISHKSPENTADNSDAESSYPSLCGKRDLPLSPEDEVVDIHELELRAYKSTVEALYASGPLTWDQESLLTNLRLSLNISDEEHLLQLRHLLSAQVL